MSAAGADPTAAATGSGSAGMARYARVKGEAEEVVKESGPAVVSIFRPGMIIGSQHTPWRRADREGDDRDVAEHAAEIGRLPLPRNDGVESVIARTHRLVHCRSLRRREPSASRPPRRRSLASSPRRNQRQGRTLEGTFLAKFNGTTESERRVTRGFFVPVHVRGDTGELGTDRRHGVGAQRKTQCRGSRFHGVNDRARGLRGIARLRAV